MDCLACHTTLPDDARFCSSCGADVTGGATGGVRVRDTTVELQERLTRTLHGRYTVRGLLGAGGMGAVFLADDLSLEREVAIKVLPPELSRDDKVVARFQREAKTAARLDHPHIIPIYRVESEAGLNYFIMKYVAGRSLEAVLSEEGQLQLPFALRVLREAAAALGQAHQRGIVHRDVKPANIMLDSEGRVVLTDFGISKPTELTADLTHTGTVIGTPYYMAPEQAMGLTVDGRADQYALAVVGYQMLAGQLPFGGDTMHAILHRHIYEQPTPISTLRRAVPTEVEQAIATAMAKKPEQRHSSMEAFARALEGQLEAANAATVRAPRMSAPELPARASARTVPMTTAEIFSSGRRRIFLAGLAASIVVAASAAWALLTRGPEAMPTSAATESPLVPNEDVATATAVAPPPVAPARAVAPDSNTTTTDTAAVLPPAAPPRVRQNVSRQARPTPARQLTATPGERLDRPERREAMLSVNSDPYGTVFLDGVEIGDTPVANHPLEVGRRYELRVEREGYRTKREVISVSGPNPIRRRFILETGAQ